MRRNWSTEEEAREFIVEWCFWSTTYPHRDKEEDIKRYTEQRIRTILKEEIESIEKG